jgi:hypothetical protein
LAQLKRLLAPSDAENVSAGSDEAPWEWRNKKLEWVTDFKLEWVTDFSSESTSDCVPSISH